MHRSIHSSEEHFYKKLFFNCVWFKDIPDQNQVVNGKFTYHKVVFSEIHVPDSSLLSDFKSWMKAF